MRRGFVQRNEHFWATVLENDTAIASNVLRFSPIVAPTDWVVRAGAATATLVRIRGHIDVVADTGATIGGGANVAFAVIVVDGDDASTFNPWTLISYQEHDVLWTRTSSVQNVSDDTGTSSLANVNFAVDIKAKRKLKADDFVYLVTFNAVTAVAGDRGIRMSAIMRDLVVVK